MTALQIRNLPDEVHRKLKARAAERGQSLSEYVASLLTREANALTPEQWRARVHARGDGGSATTDDVVALIRADRDRR